VRENAVSAQTEAFAAGANVTIDIAETTSRLPALLVTLPLELLTIA
jgi:hypothetical protein